MKFESFPAWRTDETQVVCALWDDFVDVERGPIIALGSNTKPAAKRRFLPSNLFMVRILPYNLRPAIKQLRLAPGRASGE